MVKKIDSEILKKYIGLNPNDVVFTPDHIAEAICKSFPIYGEILEPCKGEGAFLKFLPKNTEWCEIMEGKDFFEYDKKVDWIVTNPPYSTFNRFLEHSFELSENVVLLVPVAKIFKSMGTLKTVFNYGGIVSCHCLPASKAGFPFGFPCGVFYFKRNYKEKTEFKLFEF